MNKDGSTYVNNNMSINGKIRISRENRNTKVFHLQDYNCHVFVLPNFFINSCF